MNRLVLLLLLALLSLGHAALAQPLESQVKAEFLFRFLTFVEWPEAALEPAGSPLVIAVVGAEEVRAELQRIVVGRTVNERSVTILRALQGERPRAHLVFVGRDAAAALRPLAALRAVLVVAETEGALEQGALINFVVREKRVRFEVMPDEATRRGLRIGARLLAVAVRLRLGEMAP